MKRKNIKLKISDYRDLFHEPHKKQPYYLSVSYGRQSFYFSNKKKAQRFLAKFEKESTDIYKELGTYISYLYELNISLVSVTPFSDYNKKRNSLEFLSDRYGRVLNDFIIGDIEIGREINLLYETIENQMEFYRTILRTSNRYTSKYQDLRYRIKNAKRLQIEFENLFQSADGVKEVTTDFIKPNLSKLILKIA